MSTESTTFRTSAESRSKLEFLAKQEGTTFSELVNLAVSEFLNRRMPDPPLIIPIVDGPSLDELKEELVQEQEGRTAVEFQVDAPQLGICGAYPVYLYELTRITKGTAQWKFVGFVMNANLELVRVTGEYDCVSKKGQIKA